MDSLAEARGRLILALDFPSASTCFSFLDSLKADLPRNSLPKWVKVGLELFLAEGPSLVSRLREQGYEVFLDLKLHDIPNTVAGAIRAILPLAPALLTVHASGGSAMLAAAADAASASRTRLLAVTVLTSMDAAQLLATGVSRTPSLQVEALAALAHENGIDGLVCSALEAATLRAIRPSAYLVTPGIRPAGSATGDQQRVATPATAIRAGATQLVIGRPITSAADPARVIESILHEISGAMAL